MYTSVCVCVGMCALAYVCVFVYLPLRLLITSGVIWHDIIPIWLINMFYRFYMATIISIVSRRGLTIKVHHWNQPSKSKLALYKPWIHFNNLIKYLYISHKMEHFSYKSGCSVRGHTHIKTFKRRASLDYRQTASGF